MATMAITTKTSKTSRSPARKPEKKSNGSLQPERHRQRVAEAAYYLAEARGFVAGGEVRDWLAAEDEISRLPGDEA